MSIPPWLQRTSIGRMYFCSTSIFQAAAEAAGLR